MEYQLLWFIYLIALGKISFRLQVERYRCYHRRRLNKVLITLMTNVDNHHELNFVIILHSTKSHSFIILHLNLNKILVSLEFSFWACLVDLLQAIIVIGHQDRLSQVKINLLSFSFFYFSFLVSSFIFWISFSIYYHLNSRHILLFWDNSHLKLLNHLV